MTFSPVNSSMPCEFFYLFPRFSGMEKKMKWSWCRIPSFARGFEGEMIASAKGKNWHHKEIQRHCSLSHFWWQNNIEKSISVDLNVRSLQWLHSCSSCYKYIRSDLIDSSFSWEKKTKEEQYQRKWSPAPDVCFNPSWISLHTLRLGMKVALEVNPYLTTKGDHVGN